jgi:hypothetical protein
VGKKKIFLGGKIKWMDWGMGGVDRWLGNVVGRGKLKKKKNYGYFVLKI